MERVAGRIFSRCVAGEVCLSATLWRSGIDDAARSLVVSKRPAQDTRAPLIILFRAIWYLAKQKNGMRAQGLQRLNSVQRWSLLASSLSSS